MACASPQRYTKLKVRRHEFEVRAIDPAGHIDPTPAEREWRVKPKKKT